MRHPTETAIAHRHLGPKQASTGNLPAQSGRGCRRRVLGIVSSLLLAPGLSLALESDRQQPLEIFAGGTDGSLGDGVTVLSGRVEIRQGTLHVQAEEARVEKAEGKVSTIVLIGEPARLEQEIEEQGMVQAEARTITYRVSAGKVELSGAADVTHPQYQISGEQLTYDLDKQHFEGSGGVSADGDGRIRIQLEPEVAGELQGGADRDDTELDTPEESSETNPETPDSSDSGSR